MVEKPAERSTPPGQWHPMTAYVILASAMAIFPRVVEIPVWATVFCLLCWGWSLAGSLKMPSQAGRPGPRTRRVMALASLGGVLASFSGVFDLAAGASYLAVLLAVKPMENESRRDVVVGLYLVLFFNVFNVFSSQDVFMGVHLFLSSGLTMAVMAMASSPAMSLRRALRVTGGLALRGIPVMVVLFVVFPRLPGGLVHFGKDAARTGFNSVLEMGALGDLARDTSTAFRVEFVGPAPSREDMYWRGLVLWHFDGEKWYPMSNEPAALPLVNGTGLVEYDIIIEPHRENNLFSLDIPAAAPERTLFTASRVMYRAGAGRRREQARMVSYLQADTGPFLAWERAALRLPDSGNPRARELARQWRDTLKDPEAVVKEALSMFRSEPFSYTLTPPMLFGDEVDQFLFVSRRGFCEHYAASFTFLMRAAGIPARIVVGYQGGDFNPMGGYYTVRQSDAHAWAEVWLEGSGWTRFDPTAMVAPERLEQGASQTFSGEEESWWNRMVFREGTFLERGRYLWSTANYFWTKVVVDHTYRRQRQFLEWLGMRFGLGKAVALLAVGLGLGLAVAVGPLLWRKGVGGNEDPAQRLYERFCKHFAQEGLAREPWQGPADYAQALSERFPHEVERIWRFTTRFIRLRYGRVSESERRKELAGLRRDLRS